MVTQTTIQSAINSLIQDFNGRRIAFPNGQYEGECTAPIVWYLNRLGLNDIPYMANNRADGWGVSFPWQLQELFSHEAFQPGKQYPYGTILMWNSPHIAIVTRSDGSNTVQVFQQNADPNGAACGVYNRIVNNQFHICTFALVPRIEAPAPPPTYHPQTKSVDPYKARTILPATYLYTLNYDTMDALNQNHADIRPQGYPFTVVGVQYNPAVNKTFLVPEGYHADNPVGYLKDECEPIPPAPAYQPPAAPLPIPTAQRYMVVNTIKYYDDPGKTVLDNDAKGTVAPGLYYRFETRGRAIQIGKSNMKADYWINAADNVPAPIITNVPAAVAVQPAEPAPVAVPEPEPVTAPVQAPVTNITVTVASDTPEQIRASYQPFLTNNLPISARVKADVYVTELLHQGKPFLVKAGWPLHLYGVVQKNEQLYAVCRPKNQPLPPKGDDLYAIAINSRSDFSPSLREVSGLIENMRLEYENIHYSVSKSKLARTIDGVIKAKLTAKK